MASFNDLVLADGPALYYEFNDNLSKSSTNGTTPASTVPTTTPTYIATPNGRGISLPGTYRIAANYTDMGTMANWSVEAVVRTSTNDTTQRIIWSNATDSTHYRIFAIQNGVLFARNLYTGSGDASITGTKNVADGKWHHVVAESNNGYITLYVDGVADGTSSTANTNQATTQLPSFNAFFGPNSIGGYFIGDADDIAQYNGPKGASVWAAHAAVATSAYYDTVMADSPTHYYRFNNNGLDHVGAAPMTIATGYSTGTAGIKGNALTADSSATKTGSYVSGIANTVFNAVYSVEVWFKLGQHRASQQEIMRMSNELAFEIDTSGHLVYYYNGSQVTSTGTYDDNVWHHCVVTRDSARLVKVYVDAVQVGSFTANTSAPGSTALYFAGSQYTTQAFITGQLDEVALYSTALSSTAISNHYTVGRPLAGGYSPTPMTADAAMPGGLATLPKTYNATAMTATASDLTGTSSMTAVLTPSRDGYDTLGMNAGTSLQIDSSLSAIVDFELPAGFSHAGRTSAFLKLWFTLPFTGASITIEPITSEYTDTATTHQVGTGTTYTFSTTHVNTVGDWATFDVTSLTDQPFYGFRISYAGTNNISIKSQESTLPEQLTLTYRNISAAGGYSAQPLIADTVMPSALVGVAAEISGIAMTVSSDMPDATVVGERFYTYTAESADAYAETVSGAFSLPNTQSAAVWETDAMMPTPTVETAIGVIHNADPFTATSTIVRPALVNGTVIVIEEAEDKYFQRVFNLAPSVYQRLADHGSTAVDRMATYNGVYHGVIVGQYDAPDGRHSVHFPEGSYLEQNEPTATNVDEAWIQDGIALATTLEFSFRTTKANTFLMAGADSTQTSRGVASQYAARELFLDNGRITFKSRIFAGTPDAVDKLFSGVRNLADNKWHHIVVKSGVYSRGEWGVEIWVDGTFEVRRFNANGFMGFPDFIGFRPNLIDGSELETLPLSQAFEGDMTEVAFYNHNHLESHDIARNYYAFMAWSPIAPAPLEATAALTNSKGKGSQKKALYLYWNALDEVFQSGDAPEYSVSFDPMQGFVERAYQAPNLPFQNYERVGDYFGYKVFSRSVRVNTNDTSYRDPLTDDPSLINLESDIDLSEYDLIMFKDWPDEGKELDDIEYNFPGQKERLIRQLRDANDKGVGLLVTNPRMAVDLGVIDRVEYVGSLKESKYNNNQGAALGLYDYGSAVKFPWNIVASDGLTGGLYASGIGQPQNLADAYLENKAYFYSDTNDNNRFRVRAIVEGLTDLPAYMIEEAVWHVDYDQYGWQGVAYKYLKRDSGLLIGDEYIYNGAEVIGGKWLDSVANRFNRYAGTWATPPGHVKAGTIVTTFGAKHWLGKSQVDNPYKDYATTIVLQPGDVLAGRAVGGRIFVNFTEQPSYGLAVAVQQIPSGSTGWPAGYAPETTAQREWDYSWTRTSLSTTPQVTQSVSVVMPNGEVQVIQLGSADSGLSMVRSSQLFPITAKPRLEMTARGVYWLSQYTKPQEGEAVVRATAMTSTAAMPNAGITAHKTATVIAQPLLAATSMPRVAEDTYGDTIIRALPFTAEVTFTGYGKTITAEVLTADAEFVEPFDAVHAQGEQVALILHNYEATLYLKEEG